MVRTSLSLILIQWSVIAHQQIWEELSSRISSTFRKVSLPIAYLRMTLYFFTWMRSNKLKLLRMAINTDSDCCNKNQYSPLNCVPVSWIKVEQMKSYSAFHEMSEDAIIRIGSLCRQPVATIRTELNMNAKEREAQQVTDWRSAYGSTISTAMK